MDIIHVQALFGEVAFMRRELKDMQTEVAELREVIQELTAKPDDGFKPEWKHGPHLSPLGELELERLLDMGLNVNQISKRMRLTYPAAKYRVLAWQADPKLRPSYKPSRRPLVTLDDMERDPSLDPGCNKG